MHAHALSIVRVQLNHQVYNIIRIVCNAVSGQECEHRYTRQPPVTLNCNPFEATRLVMTCTAEGPRTPSFSVIWTRQRNGIDEVLHGSKIGIMIDATIVNISEILRRSSRLTVNGLSEVDDVGDCWCQVRLQNGTVLQKKSNILTLSSEAQYKGLGPCGGSQFVDKEDCIHPPQVTVPGVTDADTMTPISVQNSSNLFLTPQSTGAMEERDNKNLVSLYTGVAFTVLFCLLIVTLFTILVVLCKKKSCAFRFTTRGK